MIHYFVHSIYFIMLLVLLGLGKPEYCWCGNPVVTDSGSFLSWPQSDNTYYVDRGALGDLPESLSRQLVIKAFQEWSDVEYSSFEWNYGGTLPEDVIASNFSTYWDSDQNVMIFDTDGSITDMLGGVGASDSVLGFSKLISQNGSIQAAKALINGKMVSQVPESEIDRVYATLLHEVGHFTGLDHTQLFPEFAFDDDPENNIFLPIMFPIESVDSKSPPGLSLDDKMSLSYQNPGDNFELELGGIEGSVWRQNGGAVQGANVVAVDVDRPYVSAYALVSDLGKWGTGDFRFRGVLPGRYVIYIEPIHPSFFGVAGVGPFTAMENSPSFINPVKKEYYNGERESGTADQDDPKDRVILEVRPGEEITDINIISNEATSTVDEWTLY